MIRWSQTSSGLPGFVYFPFWEACVGTVFLILGLVVPMLFFYHNGFKLSQWDEILFATGFSIFFLMLGKSLVFQSFQANLTHDEITIYQDLRSPPVSLSVKFEDLANFTSGQDDSGKFTTLLLQYRSGETEEIYRSIDSAEIATIMNCLVELQKKRE